MTDPDQERANALVSELAEIIVRRNNNHPGVYYIPVRAVVTVLGGVVGGMSWKWEWFCRPPDPPQTDIVDRSTPHAQTPDDTILRCEVCGRVAGVPAEPCRACPDWVG